MSAVIQVQTGKPLGFQKLTVSDSAVGLTVPLNANRALIVVEDATIRWRDDGSDPSTTVGTPLLQNQSMVLDHEDSLAAFKAIRDDSTDAVLNITYSEVV